MKDIESEMEVDTVEEEVDGSILSVHVKNFFCHDNLEITFNPNVNFIVGRNGSGKSAILTALVVGLGARASATNRGSNLHSFIKKGASSASVEIKIKNSSEKAYKHNVYGDCITIVRNITASGSSSYKVKSASGEVISTRYEEVNSIILSHDIQVDNPISVLNQDDARSFHASDAKKKYQLFRKATNLDQTEVNYVRALENCEKAKSIWKRKSEASKELDKECKKWEAMYEQIQFRAETEELKRNLQDEYYWSEIVEYENEVDKLQKQYDTVQNKLDKLVKELRSIEQNFGSNSDVIETLKASLQEKNKEKSKLEQEVGQLGSRGRELQSSWRSSELASSKLQERYTREKNKIASLENEISSVSTSDAENRRSALEARAKATQEAAEAVHARFDTAQNDAQQARLNAQRASQAAEEFATRIQRQKDTVKHLKMQHRELESRGSDSLAVYGTNMVELCQRIQAASQRGVFSAPPKGPVGSYLKVKDKKWAGTLEHIIGGSMQSFCVNTPEDSRKLFQLMGQVYGSAPKPAVTCSKFLNNQHDVSKNKVQSAGYFSALDSLHITDPVIANYLIDNLAIETILLVPEHEDAIKLSDNVRNVPKNCSKVVTLDCTEFMPAPNYRSYGGAGRASRYLQVSTADRKRQVEIELAEVEKTIAALEKEAKAAAREAQAAKKAENDSSRMLQALVAEVHDKDAAARAAKSKLEHQQAPLHRILQDELEVSKSQLLSVKQQLEESKVAEQNNKQLLDQHATQLDTAKARMVEVAAACRELNEEISQEQLKIEQCVTKRQMATHKLKEDQRMLDQLGGTLAEKKETLERKIAGARSLCDRIENPREKSLLVSELKNLQAKLNAMKIDGLSKEQVAAKYLEVQKKYKHIKRVLDRLSNLISEVHKTSDKHLNFCHRVQSYIAKRVQYCFQSVLTLRGYSGRMEIDSGKGLLEVWCSGRETAARSASSTSSLSGGERSYSTVAFLMALWECVELPFYFMDEFDVFMDNVNRKIVMQLLIDHALKNSNRQFVFLTPQDASSVNAGPRIRIHRMADPRR